MTDDSTAERLRELQGREAARNLRIGAKTLMELPLQRRITFAIYDPGAITPRGDNYCEAMHRWQARAVLYVLDPDHT
ncbi:hypothetical protein [Streptomyces misionensis]